MSQCLHGIKAKVSIFESLWSPSLLYDEINIYASILGEISAYI